MKENKQDTKTKKSTEELKGDLNHDIRQIMLPKIKQNQGFKPSKNRDTIDRQHQKFYLADSTGPDSKSRLKKANLKKMIKKNQQAGQMQGKRESTPLASQIISQFKPEGEVVASAQPCLYQLENSKRGCDLKIIDSHSQQNPKMQNLIPQENQFLNHQTNQFSVANLNGVEEQTNQKGAMSEQKSGRRNRKRKRHIGCRSHYNVWIEDFRNLNNQDFQSIDYQQRAERENIEALRDLKLHDRTQKMSSQTQSRLIKDGKRGSPEAFIFSKYCPLAPHNTTQFISHEFDSRMGSISSSSFVLSLLLQDNSHQIPNEAYSYNEDDLSLGGHKSNNDSGDSVSCCNNKNNTQNLLGSASSSKVNQSTTTCSIASRSINFTALEQIGASMEGFVDQDMFEDLELSDYETNLSSSTCINGKQTEKALAVDDFKDIHAPQILLDSEQDQHQQQNKNCKHKRCPSPAYLIPSTDDLLSFSFEEKEQFELIHLEQSLTSHRLMIEQLERELQYKNSMISEMEMINQSIVESDSSTQIKCRTQTTCI